MSKKENAKYYDMSKNDANSIMEDFFASEEEQALQEKLDEGFIDLGTFDADDEEAWDKVLDKAADMME